MGLLDLFTGAASERGARNNASAIQAATTLGTNALTGGATAALGYLLDGSGPSAMTALQGGYGRARGDISSQAGATQQLLGQQGDLYNHMAEGGQNAYDRYLDSVGANGAAGSAAATANFQSAPGYQYAQGQALDAVQRTAAARGGLAGGNATADILKTATGLADQSYQQYVQNLGNAAGSYGTALAGQGSALGARANASQTYGTQLGTLDTGLGTGTAGLYGLGAGVQTDLGKGVSNLQTNASGQLVSNNNNLAASENAAGANILGGILGGARLLAGGAGSAAGGGAATGGGFGSFLSGLFR